MAFKMFDLFSFNPKSVFNRKVVKRKNQSAAYCRRVQKKWDKKFMEMTGKATIRFLPAPDLSFQRLARASVDLEASEKLLADYHAGWPCLKDLWDEANSNSNSKSKSKFTHYFED